MTSEHYFSEKPKSKIVLTEINVLVRGHHFTFTLAAGIFSARRLDPASALLAEHAPIMPNWRVLDLGCGWGAIGIIIKKAFPSTDVYLTDINRRALSTARNNAKKNNAAVTILHGTLYGPVKNMQFDTILCNPPMKAGRELCYQTIEQAKAHLKPGGMLQLVALHNRGGSMLERKMKEIFGNVETIAKRSGFRVYVSRNEAGM